MKLKVLSALTVIGMFIGNLSVATAADIPYEVPKVVSFTVSQKQIDVNTANAKLTFTLTVSHPLGIYTARTILWVVSRDSRVTLKTFLNRQTSTLSSKEVVFEGELTLEPGIPTGIYDFYAEPIQSNIYPSRDTGTFTPLIYPLPFHDFINAENSIIVRKSGKLNLDIPTFVGPSHTSFNKISDSKPVTFLDKSPIFRVGETYNPKDYFSMRIKDLDLLVETFTPEVCKVENNILKFIKIGFCTFRVFTFATDDFLSTSITLSASISSSRIKTELFLPFIADQDVRNVPKQIVSTPVYSSSGALVAPSNVTPEVCFANVQFITIVGGGRCILNYQSAATNDYLASDLYQLAFDVTKDPQTVTFKPTATVDVATKTLDLSATATSGGSVTFNSNSKEICTVEGSKAMLLKSGNCEIVATQAGTSLIAAASAAATIQIIGKVAKTRTIRCVKGNKTKGITGVKPKCPKGFKKA